MPPRSDTAAPADAERDTLYLVIEIRRTIRNEIAPGLRAIPAGKRAIIAFTVDDANEELLVQVVSYSGADWISRSRARVL